MLFVPSDGYLCKANSHKQIRDFLGLCYVDQSQAWLDQGAQAALFRGFLRFLAQLHLQAWVWMWAGLLCVAAKTAASNQ